jgi:hypothetical protein
MENKLKKLIIENKSTETQRRKLKRKNLIIYVK